MDSDGLCECGSPYIFIGHRAYYGLEDLWGDAKTTRIT
jgi:hypothetical protein